MSDWRKATGSIYIGDKLIAEDAVCRYECPPLVAIDVFAKLAATTQQIADAPKARRWAKWTATTARVENRHERRRRAALERKR